MAVFGTHSKPPAPRARLSVEALEAREVPAVGKWIPAPAPVAATLPLGLQAEVRLMDAPADNLASNIAEV
jgi:hypothetical protein